MTRNIQATDAQGNKVSEPVQINGVDPTSSGGGGGAFEDTDGDSVAELQDSHADFVGGDARNIGVFDATEASITNETLITVEKTTNQSLTAAAWTTVNWDNEGVDNRSEFDLTNNQFIPDKTGYYLITANFRFSIGADQDRLFFRLRNVDGSSNVRVKGTAASGANTQDAGGTIVAQLTAGTTYEVQVENVDSSDTLVGDSSRTWVGLRRVLVE